MSRTLLACFGDSITECCDHAESDRWTAQLALLLENHFPGKFNVHNRGIGGNTTTMALDRIHHDVLPLLPGIVFIQFGINDAYVFLKHDAPRVSLLDYGRNIREIVKLVSNGGCPVVVINHPITRKKHLHQQGNGNSIGENLVPYNEALRSIVREQRLNCIDLPCLFKEHNISLAQFLSSDGVHLSSEGNRIYAQLVFSGLMKLIDQKETLQNRDANRKE